MMEDLLKMLIPFYSVPKNYEEVLRRLAAIAFCEITIILNLLASNPHISNLISSFEAKATIKSLMSLMHLHKSPELLIVVASLLLALGSNILKLHDRISDLFGIRRRFDVRHILLPLAGLVGATCVGSKVARVVAHRDSLMPAVFYKYASSRLDDPLVDRHDLEHALNMWSWFWALLEGVVYFLVGSIVAYAFSSITLGIGFTVIALLMSFLAVAQYSRLGKYTQREISTIADNQAAAAQIRERFDAL